MYTVDERDVVVQMRGVPRPDVGAPLPVVLRDEWTLLLAYLVSEPDPNWDGTYVKIVSAESEGMPVAVVKFRQDYAIMFGPPNDEAFEYHSRDQGPCGLRPTTH